MRLLLPGLLALGLVGCNTPCQKLCITMADYADECGLVLPADALDTCLDEQSSDQDQGACRRVGDPDTLRTEWTCEDVAVFFE